MGLMISGMSEVTPVMISVGSSGLMSSRSVRFSSRSAIVIAKTPPASRHADAAMPTVRLAYLPKIDGRRRQDDVDDEQEEEEEDDDDADVR